MPTEASRHLLPGGCWTPCSDAQAIRLAKFDGRDEFVLPQDAEGGKRLYVRGILWRQNPVSIPAMSLSLHRHFRSVHELSSSLFKHFDANWNGMTVFLSERFRVDSFPEVWHSLIWLCNVPFSMFTSAFVIPPEPTTSRCSAKGDTIGILQMDTVDQRLTINDFDKSTRASEM